MGGREFERVRRIAVALPDVNERFSHGAPCFFIGDKRPLCYYHDDHRGDGRISLWCPAPPGIVQELVSSEPERFFVPQQSARGTF
ncbi:MAG: MmcQ/YjbR family DNA-binding protein, partial [Acidimicrobiales bacterium]